MDAHLVLLYALSVVASCLCGIALLFIHSYTKEKGKNLASKEDLAHLTNVVERVKSTHNAEIERLKSALQSESQVIERRRKVYEEICASLKIFVAGHSDSIDARERLYEAYATAWLWASDRALDSLNRLLLLQTKNAAQFGSIDQSVMKQAYADTLLAMRRDAGFAHTQLRPEDYQFFYVEKAPNWTKHNWAPAGTPAWRQLRS